MPVLPRPSVSTHALPHVSFTSLATPSRGTRETSMWRVELAASDEVPAPHSVTREELFFVLRGTARVHWEASVEEAGPGDVIVVPPGVPFSLCAAGPAGADGPATAELLCCLPVGGQARQGEAVFTPPWAQ
jgi:quercetin dioxygenase-like cupin family protein